MLSRQHHLLEGVACDQLSQAFREEGLLLMDVLSDDRMAHLCDVMGVARAETLSADQVSHTHTHTHTLRLVLLHDLSTPYMVALDVPNLNYGQSKLPQI